MSHSTFSDLDKHSENGLLKRITKILWGIFAVGEKFRSSGLDETQQSAERDIHALDTIGQLKVLGALLGRLLDVESGRWVVAELEAARESVQTVTHCDVDRLAKDPVALVLVAYHLRVAARHVQNGRIARSCYQAAHFYVADAVVNSDYWLLPQL